MAQTYDVKLFQRGGVTMVLYPDGDEAVLADVMRYMNPGSEFDQATGEQMATPPPPAESATYSGSTVRDKPFGSIAGGMAEPYMSQAYDALTRAPVVDPNSYVPESVQRINQTLGNTGSAALSGLLGLNYGGAGLVGDVANATGLGGGQRLANDLAGMVEVAGVGPEARMVEVLSNAGAARTIARTVAERANQRGPVPTMGSNFANLLGESVMGGGGVGQDLGAASRVGNVDPVVSRGQGILDMLTLGRAGEITDEMLDMGDPVANARLDEYLSRNYDLPMDQASRMERAQGMGFDYVRRSQSQDTPFNDVQWAMFADARGDIDGALESLQGYGDGQWLGRPNSRGRQAVKDLVRAGRESSNYHGMTGAEIARRGLPDDIVNSAGLWDDVDTARLVSDEILSLGGRSIESPDGMIAFRPDGVPYPADNSIRSRFARFDPRLAHLRNLSAGVAISPLAYGLLSDQYEREKYR